MFLTVSLLNEQKAIKTSFVKLIEVYSFTLSVRFSGGLGGRGSKRVTLSISITFGKFATHTDISCGCFASPG